MHLDSVYFAKFPILLQWLLLSTLILMLWLKPNCIHWLLPFQTPEICEIVLLYEIVQHSNNIKELVTFQVKNVGSLLGSTYLYFQFWQRIVVFSLSAWKTEIVRAVLDSKRPQSPAIL